VLREQLLDMQRHGIGVAIVSWWGRPGVSAGDSQGVVNDEFVGLAFQEADAVGMSIALHLEPYHGRDVGAVRDDVVYLRRRYGRHASWQHIDGRPVYYVYDSYHIHAADWALLLQPEGRGGRFNFTLRAPPPHKRGHATEGVVGSTGLAGIDDDEDAAWASRYTDGFFIGLWLDRQHGDDLVAGGFDGAYSYFATEGFSFGSTPANWRFMQEASEGAGLLFVPCVSPGYDDSKIRPWCVPAAAAAGVVKRELLSELLNGRPALQASSPLHGHLCAAALLLVVQERHAKARAGGGAAVPPDLAGCHGVRGGENSCCHVQ
jgi:glycoprotein endo-alpha-1,2-mannosidase